MCPLGPEGNNEDTAQGETRRVKSREGETEYGEDRVGCNYLIKKGFFSSSITGPPGSPWETPWAALPESSSATMNCANCGFWQPRRSIVQWQSPGACPTEGRLG